jgi:EAL and modified HD-GYP domain-containing signal transduction protein
MTQRESQPVTYIVRQPILDAKECVYGYELRFREAGTRLEQPRDDRGAAGVLTDAILTIGLETLTSMRPAFLTFNRELLLAGAPTLLPSASLVVCVPGTLAADSEVVTSCRALRAAGYTLAVDRFDERGADALLPHVKFVKVDLPAWKTESLSAAVARLGSSIQVVASQVDSADAYASARAVKSRYFQGFYFCEPVMRPTQPLPARQMACMNLLAALNRPNLSIAELEELVKRDVSLAVRVLRSVNSAAFASGREITSIRQALVLLGIDQVRKWASVWSLAGLGKGIATETTSLALIRARCCELIGQRLSGADAAGEMFLLGLCSLLDTLLSRPMELAIADVQLPADVREALLGGPNFGRSVLDAVIAYERADWSRATSIAASIELPEGVLSEAYTDALPWACQLANAA